MDELYAIRMRRAAFCSVVLHALLFLPISALERTGGPGTKPEPAPLVLRLQQPEQAPPRQLVDVTDPAETVPIERTDLIAEENSLAQDREPWDGDSVGPQFDREDPFDTLAALEPAPPLVPAVVPLPEPTPEEVLESPREEAVEPAVAEENPEYLEAPPAVEPAPERLAKAAPLEPPMEMLEPMSEIPVEPRMQVAQVPRPGQAEFGGPESKGRSRDAVRKMGLMNFEAIADQVAPYLKQVKLRVERRWNEALLNHYRGLTPTEAIIECAISPDGRVVSATVVGAPADRVFAALCRDAIMRAGPFGPFTFEVPDLYRNQNLEIRWTFSFL